jgi:hypothetical protein
MRSRFLMSRPAVCVLRFNVSTTPRYIRGLTRTWETYVLTTTGVTVTATETVLRVMALTSFVLVGLLPMTLSPSEAHPEKQCNKFWFQTKMEQWQHVRPANLGRLRRRRELPSLHFSKRELELSCVIIPTPRYLILVAIMQNEVNYAHFMLDKSFPLAREMFAV